MPDAAIWIGLDLGTTALKAAAFDGASGRVLARAGRRLATRTEADGTREQDAEHLCQALGEAVAGLRAGLAPEAWARVSGVGLAAQGGSGGLFRRCDGVPLTPLYLWNDSRAAALMPEVIKARPQAYWRTLSQRRGPGMGLARMLWLQRRDPGCLGGDVLYAGAGELAIFQLTGVWRQDACNALQMGCYDVLQDRLAAEPLAAVGVRLDQVAPLRPGHATLPLSVAGAALLGLPAGIPVAGPYMDHEAGYLSALGVCERPLQASLGTAWVGNFEMPGPQSGWSPVQLVIASPRQPGRSLVIQPLLTGNVSWEWGLRAYADPELGVALRRAGEWLDARLLPPGGMVCVPWFAQANPWAPGVGGAGVYAGISAHVEAADFLRALVLGLSCEFYRVFRELSERHVVDGLVLGGGASQGTGFRTVLAALFSPLPVWVCADQDVGGARGTLAAFDARLAQSPATPVEVPESARVEEIRRAYGVYDATFAAIYGSHPSGAPYRLT